MKPVIKPVINQNEKIVDTEGVDLDVYFCDMRDSAFNLQKTVGAKTEIIHTDRVSKVAMRLNGSSIAYRLYKEKFGNKLVSKKITVEVW